MSVGHINTENIPGVDKLVDSSAGDGAGASAGAGATSAIRIGSTDDMPQRNNNYAKWSH